MSASSISDVRKLILPIYLPGFFATLAQKLVVAALPLYVKNGLHGDDVIVGTITSMQGLGAFTTAALAGYIISFVGDRYGMIIGAAVACAAYFACMLVTLVAVMDESMALLAIASFGTGIGKSAFEVARNSFMAANVPKALRGRANGLIGGCARVASMLGPALGGIVVHSSGADSAAFVAQTLVGAATVALLVVGVPSMRAVDERATIDTQQNHQQQQQLGELAIASSADTASMISSSSSASDAPQPASELGDDSGTSQPHRRFAACWRGILVPLLTAAPIGFSFGFVRGARSLLIPLKADAIDLSASAVGYVTAASFACDSLLFPLGGHISDRYGRKAAGVPSLCIMGMGCLLLALSRDLWSVTLASALLGVGNALSSGIVQTVGQDAAPADPRARSQFLGLFKVCTDAGTFLGPLAVGLVANAAGLDAAAEVIAAAAVACALWYAGMKSRRETRCCSRILRRDDGASISTTPAAAAISKPRSNRRKEADESGAADGLIVPETPGTPRA